MNRRQCLKVLKEATRLEEKLSRKDFRSSGIWGKLRKSGPELIRREIEQKVLLGIVEGS
jgi:hypothetical protein